MLFEKLFRKKDNKEGRQEGVSKIRKRFYELYLKSGDIYVDLNRDKGLLRESYSIYKQQKEKLTKLSQEPEKIFDSKVYTLSIVGKPILKSRIKKEVKEFEKGLKNAFNNIFSINEENYIKEISDIVQEIEDFQAELRLELVYNAFFMKPLPKENEFLIQEAERLKESIDNNITSKLEGFTAKKEELKELYRDLIPKDPSAYFKEAGAQAFDKLIAQFYDDKMTLVPQRVAATLGAMLLVGCMCIGPNKNILRHTPMPDPIKQAEVLEDNLVVEEVIDGNEEAQEEITAIAPTASEVIDALEVIEPAEEDILETRLYKDSLRKIPILMYHKIGDVHQRYWVTPHDLRRHLQKLYDRGYQLISLEDYIKQDFSSLLPGKKPAVITFDDADAGQLTYLTHNNYLIGTVKKGDFVPAIDPKCAVGVMKKFYEEHPDFGFEATFFVDFVDDSKQHKYEAPFMQAGYVKLKLNHLLDMGLDIGNHTYHHYNLRKLSQPQLKKELALAMAEFERYLGERVERVKIVAYPYGAHPSINPRTQTLKLEYKGRNYELIAGMDAFGWQGKRMVSRWGIPRIETDNSTLNIAFGR